MTSWVPIASWPYLALGRHNGSYSVVRPSSSCHHDRHYPTRDSSPSTKMSTSNSRRALADDSTGHGRQLPELHSTSEGSARAFASWHYPTYASWHYPTFASWHYPTYASWHYPTYASWHYPTFASWHYPTYASWHPAHHDSTIWFTHVAQP
jgi:hypothetical protein